ncbi:hypothetical protein EDB95_2896 [Dinghuibacter silviterrae]|uniref:Uncharacterized protein n=1 Tax=Dinghuibacter silviterrae TaxID=1539049 RepID=A0A4R8DU27_9BACT|nr:hypothetical protein EDB95_2896 [Dinghuibacter silviterrae]
MLSAIAVLAVVGGALAFSARTNELTTYCTTTLQGGNFCLDQVDISTTTNGSNIYKYTTVDDGVNCDANTGCQGQTSFTHE